MFVSGFFLFVTARCFFCDVPLARMRAIGLILARLGKPTVAFDGVTQNRRL
jgi:hypothetical protein